MGGHGGDDKGAASFRAVCVDTSPVPPLMTLVRDAVRDLTGRELSDADFRLPFEDIELDSLILVDVICEVEDHLGIELEDGVLEQLIGCESLADMIDTYEAGVRPG